MSRVAKKPVELPANVEVKIADQAIEIKGPKGKERFQFSKLVTIKQENKNLQIESANDSADANMNAGTTRAIIANMVLGVTTGFEKKLVLIGVGYRAQVQGKNLNLTLGLSHPVVFMIPEGVVIETPSQTEINVKGSNKQLIGQVAANIRHYRSPEPYKGKGIRYADEIIILKETKKK